MQFVLISSSPRAAVANIAATHLEQSALQPNNVQQGSVNVQEHFAVLLI